MATKDWHAVIYQLKNSISITSLLGVDSNGTPNIVYGDFSLAQNFLPGIAFTRLNKSNDRGIEQGFFRINCYAEKQSVSSDIAENVNEVFRDSIGHIDNYPLQADSKIMASIWSDGCYNTPVQIKIVHKN